MREQTPRSSLMAVAISLAATAVFVAPVHGQLTMENSKILADDGEEFDQFGWAVALDNGLLAVGTNAADDQGANSGSAYLFSSSTGMQLFKLLPVDGAADDYFGYSIALQDGVVAVGAVWDRDNGIEAGSAYLFEASTGLQLHKLLPADGAADAWFGYSIAIDGGTVVVGAAYDDAVGNDSGAAYIFDAITGAQLLKLVPTDAAPDDLFGYAVAVRSGVVALGAVWDDDNGTNSGSVYLFDASTGVQIDKLLPSDGGEHDFFGTAVDLDSGVVAVGARGDDDNGSAAGAAYLFEAATGNQTAKLLPADGEAEDQFGASIAIDRGVVVVGAPGADDNGSDSGAAYVFDAGTGVQLRKCLPADGAAGDGFGYSVAASMETLVAGTPFDDDNGADSGSAYVCRAVCRADLTGDGTVDTLDFLLFLGAWSQGDPLADWDGNGLLNTLDFLAYLNDWSAC